MASPLLLSLACAAGALVAPPPAAQEDDGRGGDLAFFEREVRPLLVEHCLQCHGEGKRRPKGGLRLDSRAGWARGGDSGPALAPGDVEGSLIVRAVRYRDPSLEMPPDGRLPDEAVRVFEEWVRRGAPDPRTDAEPEATPDAGAPEPHWAFQPMADPVPPEVRDAAWARNEIDRFVLARLEAEGLAPAPEADRRTLLRRASYDLLGLPPSADEIERFAADPAPDAWEREVERLLASPHYGERWGRHWLDLARYADSNGLDENLAMGNAWRYRDWVVRAFAADLPYDRFVTLQLAGDLLPEPEDEDALRDQLVATGFLVLGPKMLAEQDKEKLQMDVVDEQLDVAGQAFLGLTLGCARCHDHKFDPVSQRDYTALAGIFKSTRTLANLGFVSRWNQRELASRARVEERAQRVADRDASRAEVKALLAEGEQELRGRAQDELARYLLAAQGATGTALLVEAEDFSRGNLNVDRSSYGSERSPIVHTNQPGTQFVEYDLTFAAPARLRLEVRYAAEASRPVRITLDGTPVAEAALSETTGGWGLGAQRWHRVALLDVRSGRNVLRLEREVDFPHVDQLLLVPAATLEDDAWLAAAPEAGGLAPAYLRGWVVRLESAARGRDPLLGLWARFAALPEADFEAHAAEIAEAPGTNALVAALARGLAPTSLRELAGRYQTLLGTLELAGAAEPAPPAVAELRTLLHGPEAPFALRPEELETLLPEERREALVAARARLAEREAAIGPPFERALAATEAEAPVELPIFVRGSHLNPGDEPVPRGFPEVLTAVLPAAPIPAEHSGRLELARWLTDPEHPLTARVMANRVWAGHFGEGLVRTPSNFGRRGAAPTHPELLDWLARTLVRDGWSLKALHRRILTSATYRMGSVPAPEALERDPENRLMAHAFRRRLDAEAVRDSLLAVAGTLDRARGGTLLTAGDGDYVTNDQSGDQGRYDAPRRSLYLPIVRNAMYDFFSAFDYRDPSLPVDQRPSTAAPAQALWLMNSPLVLSAARRVAEDLAAEVPAPAERIEALYRRALGRAPRDEERRAALAFLERTTSPAPTAGAVEAAAEAPAPGLAWRALAQTLFLTNEFLYID